MREQLGKAVEAAVEREAARREVAAAAEAAERVAVEARKAEGQRRAEEARKAEEARQLAEREAREIELAMKLGLAAAAAEAPAPAPAPKPNGNTKARAQETAACLPPKEVDFVAMAVMTYDELNKIHDDGKKWCDDNPYTQDQTTVEMVINAKFMMERMRKRAVRSRKDK